jgi:hypothetical protein
MKKVTPKQRTALSEKYLGRCAYCGCRLEKGWHADHFEAVKREFKLIRGKGFVPTGEVAHPERDTLENMMPSCGSCNIDKRKLKLEVWRKELEEKLDCMYRYQPNYRIALRFGLIEEMPKPIVFFFEQVEQGMVIEPLPELEEDAPKREVVSKKRRVRRTRSTYTRKAA